MNAKINVTYLGCRHTTQQDLEEFLSTKGDQADFLRQHLPAGAKDVRYKEEAGPCPSCFKKAQDDAKAKAEADEAVAAQPSADEEEAAKKKASEAPTVA